MVEYKRTNGYVDSGHIDSDTQTEVNVSDSGVYMCY